MNNKDFIQDAKYAEHFSGYRVILDRLLDHGHKIFGIEKNKHIVDIGCGMGEMLIALRDDGYLNIIGVEPDIELLSVARQRGLDARDGTITETGLPNKSADAVIVNNVFHHIADYEKAANEISRVLVPGGLLCFIEPLNTPLRILMDFATFNTPLRRFIPAFESRHRVMGLEIETGMYPKFLSEQKSFHKAINGRFSKQWHKRTLLFQMGKYSNL